MSRSHPIISITGSSGAGTTSVKKTFENIFRREKVSAAYIEGDAFHRYNRVEMRNRMAEEAARKMGATARAGSRQMTARRREFFRRSTTHVKPGPNKFRMAINRCQAKCRSRMTSSGGASFISRFQER